MYSFYLAVTTLASPFAPILLKRRFARGKEDGERMPERLGRASVVRPQGKLLWIHAASVGESIAVLPLVEALLEEDEQLHVLLTTVTVTSAALMAQRLPERALHQFAPLDTPSAVQSFLNHWKPDVALWVDSELWPNLIMQTHKNGTAMGIVNARMSERSFKRWKLLPSFIRPLLACFSLCFAQSEEDAKRLLQLGLPAVTRTGNLKYEAPPLPYSEGELARVQAQAAGRDVWLAASTHPGEEALIGQAHSALAASGLNPLTIIVPRHASRGEAIAMELASFSIKRRSRGEPIGPKTDIYIADTMGELGLFYRLAPVVFIGGSLVPHGGQNPLEAARLGCAIVTGPHMQNFAAIMQSMQRDGAVTVCRDAQQLAETVRRLQQDSALRETFAHAALRHTKSHAGILAAITQELQRILV